MKKEVILLEVGVFTDHLNKYRNVYDNLRGYYDEDQTYADKRDLEQVIAKARDYLTLGVEGTYAFITDQGLRDINDWEQVSDLSLDGSESYEMKDVIWSAIKEQGRIREDYHTPNQKDVDQLFQTAYHRYRLQWMMDHGYSFEQLLMGLQDQLDNGSKNLWEAFTSFVLDAGFGGSIWACEEEFKETEWTDNDYMKKLLSPTEFIMWYNHRYSTQKEGRG